MDKQNLLHAFLVTIHWRFNEYEETISNRLSLFSTVIIQHQTLACIGSYVTCTYFEIPRRVLYYFQINIEPILGIRDTYKFGKEQTRIDCVCTLETIEKKHPM